MKNDTNQQTNTQQKQKVNMIKNLEMESRCDTLTILHVERLLMLRWCCHCNWALAVDTFTNGTIAIVVFYRLRLCLKIHSLVKQPTSRKKLKKKKSRTKTTRISFTILCFAAVFVCLFYVLFLFGRFNFSTLNETFILNSY